MKTKKKTSTNRQIERKILIMFAFYSLSYGLFDCFKQLWLQANDFSAIEISSVISVALLLSIVASMVMSFAMDMTRIKNMMTSALILYVLNLLFMYFISGRSHLGMSLGVIVDAIAYYLITSAVYPLITMVAKSNKSYNRRRLVGYFAKDFGMVICGVFTGRMIGDFLIDYEASILIAFVLGLFALAMMFTFEISPATSHKTKYFETAAAERKGNFLAQIGQSARSLILLEKHSQPSAASSTSAKIKKPASKVKKNENTKTKSTSIKKNSASVKTKNISKNTEKPKKTIFRRPQVSRTFTANVKKYKQFLKYTFSHKIFVLYFGYSILATMSFAAVMGLKMLMMIGWMDFTIDSATQYLLYAGFVADIAGVLAFKRWTPKNDYVTVTIKFGIRLLGYFVAIFADNIAVSLAAITWGIFTSTIYEGVTDGHYINLVPDKYQFQFNATRTAVRCIGEALGVWICGLVYHNGPTAMIATSALIMVAQMVVAYQLIYLRQKRHIKRHTASRKRYEERMV